MRTLTCPQCGSEVDYTDDDIDDTGDVPTVVCLNCLSDIEVAT